MTSILHAKPANVHKMCFVENKITKTKVANRAHNCKVSLRVIKMLELKMMNLLKIITIRQNLWATKQNNGNKWVIHRK